MPAARDIGDHIGRYRLLRAVGKGAEAEVWKAEALGPAASQRTVALKLFLRSGAYPLRPEHRFRGLLGHPHLVEIYEVGRHEEQDFLALEWVGGGSLEDVISRSPLPARAVVDLGLQLADALAHLHERGLVHRDVKPMNVLLTRSGTAKLSDLGLSLIHISEPTRPY